MSLKGKKGMDEPEEKPAKDGCDGVKRLKAENFQMRNSKTCRICLDNDSDRLFLPCAHLVVCKLCSPFVTHCNLCNTKIAHIVPVYRM